MHVPDIDVVQFSKQQLSKVQARLENCVAGCSYGMQSHPLTQAGSFHNIEGARDAGYHSTWQLLN